MFVYLRWLQNSYNHGVLGRILGNRIIKWILRIVIFLFILENTLNGLDALGIIDLESFFDEEDASFSATNPYRDLPDDPAVHNTIREVLFIGDTLRDGLLPTSLPDDDYDLYSKLLRSLETRQDMTWLVLQETGIDKTIMAIANRGGSPRSPIPEEPHRLQARAKALHGHWWELQRSPEHPERWSPRFDTTRVTPLLEAKKLADGADTVEPFTLELDLEQAAEADKKYSAYRTRRDWKVSYLKRHPPTPLAWSPVPQKEGDTKSAWDTIFTDGVVEAGKKIMASQLAGNAKFKPMYRDLITERVPYSWVNPDVPAVEKTDEEYAQESKALQAEMERLEVRREKQKAFQEILAIENEVKRSGSQMVKEEL